MSGQTPLLKEQFPGVSGVLSFDAKMSGTRHAPHVALSLRSPALRLGSDIRNLFQWSLNGPPRRSSSSGWNGGDILNASGKIGLEGSQPLDAQGGGAERSSRHLGSVFSVESETAGGAGRDY